MARRMEKICKSCLSFMPENERVEAECYEDQDVKSEQWCELYTKTGKGEERK